MRERFRSSSPSDSEENYHLQSGDSPTKADEDSSEWVRNPTITVSVVPLAEPSSDDGWVRKKKTEETKSSPSEPTEDPDALRESRYATSIVLPYHDRHREEKPCWYLNISREPRQ
jgi:hypothetical protein